jgi:hypothetical protein
MCRRGQTLFGIAAICLDARAEEIAISPQSSADKLKSASAPGDIASDHEHMRTNCLHADLKAQ